MSEITALVTQLQRQNDLLQSLTAQQFNHIPGLGVRRDVAALASGSTVQKRYDYEGLFSTSGLDNVVLSNHVRPSGLGSILPAFESLDSNPFFSIITGVGPASGNEPVNPCDNAPHGFMTTGTLTAKYGHVSRDTPTIRTPDLIRKINRGVMTDLVLQNSLLRPEGAGLQYPAGISGVDVIDDAVRANQVLAGIAMERKLAQLLWSGSGTVQTAGKGYVEFPGLNAQIATGQVDAETNTALPGLDSIIMNFGYKKLGATGADIVEPLSAAEAYIQQLAEDVGLGTVEGIFVMRGDLWRELTQVWPITYATSLQPSVPTGTQVFISASDNLDQRDAMRRNMTLVVNGNPYNVVTDNMLPRENKATKASLPLDHFASDIVFVPLRVGGLPVLYWEYLDHRLSVSQASALMGKEMFWSDGGRFLWSMDGTFTCFKLKVEVDPRVVLRTPQFAFRLEDVMYKSTIPFSDADPADAYWKGQGVSQRNVNPSFNAVWS